MGSLKKGRASEYASLKIVENGVTPEEEVDLRSDTVTKPSQGMREAMFKAVVGDDVMREDPTVQELEAKVAAICGKESGLFVTSATQGNLISALVHCDERGSEMIVGDQAHMFHYEQGNISQFGGIHSSQIPNNKDGTFDIEGIIERIRSDDVHYPKTKLVCVENTHNRCGGRVLPLKWLDEIGSLAKEYGLKLHMDGARVFNASVASGVPVSRIVQDFDSVSICFSKGLSAPVGCVIVGNSAFIEKARRIRKALGGGMRQVGLMAAAALYSLDHVVKRLHEDHEKAKKIAEVVNAMKSPKVYVENVQDLETNIIMLNVKGLDITEFCTRLGIVEEKEKEVLGKLVSVKCTPWSASRTRLVTHSDLTHDMAILAAKKICYVTQEMINLSPA